MSLSISSQRNNIGTNQNFQLVQSNICPNTHQVNNINTIQSYSLQYPSALTTAQMHAKAQVDLALDDLQKLIEHANHNHENPEIKEKLEAKIDDAIRLIKTNIPSAREALFLISSVSHIHYPTIKTEAFNRLIDLLENDPMNQRSSDGLISLAVDMVNQLETSKSQKLSPKFQMKLATACGLVLDLINQHHAKKHLNAVTQGLQDQQYFTKRDLTNLNSTHDPELKLAIQMIQQGLSRLTTDTSKLEKVASYATSIGNAVCGIYNKQLSNALTSLKDLRNNIGKNLSDKWFDYYSVCKELARGGVHDMDRLTAILYLIKKNPGFEMQAYGATLISQIICESSNPAVQNAALNGVTLKFTNKDEKKLPGLVNFLNYNHFTQNALIRASDDDKSKDLAVKIHAMKGILKLMDSQNPSIRDWARTTMREFFKTGDAIAVGYIQRGIDDENLLNWLKGTAPVYPQLVITSPSTTVVTIISNSKSHSPVSSIGNVFNSTYNDSNTPPELSSPPHSPVFNSYAMQQPSAPSIIQEISLKQETMSPNLQAAELHFKYGKIQFDNKNDKLAMEQFKLAIENNPNFIKAKIYFAVSLGELEGLEIGVDFLNKIVNEDPNNALAHFYLGSFLNRHWVNNMDKKELLFEAVKSSKKAVDLIQNNLDSSDTGKELLPLALKRYNINADKLKIVSTVG